MGTKPCCWGECKTDSRYPEKWPESLEELENSGQKVFIPFPRPVTYSRQEKESRKDVFVA